MPEAIVCPNHEANLKQCPCPKTDCNNRGFCCLCAQAHVAKNTKSFCMRGTERPAETRSLKGVAKSKCDNYKKNLAICPCDYEPCGNRGTCCDCIRNHWGNATYPLAACMRA
jgi:hypothetical protein